MAIVVVGGGNRGVGKTALVCGLIRALPEYRWTAIKITTHEHGMGQPIWEDQRPAAGVNPDAALAVREAPDTARYLRAGAARAFLATAVAGSDGKLADLPGLLNRLWPMFGRGTNFIFESNTVVHHVSADVCLLIHGGTRRGLPLPERKPSFTAAVRFADAMVTEANGDAVTPEGLRLEDQGPKPIFHLAALERISPELLAFLRRKLPPDRHF